MGTKTPLLNHLRKVLDDHTLPLDDLEGGLIEAIWLIHMIHKVEVIYEKNELI